MAEKLFNDPGTTLSAGIDNSVTTIPVTSAAVYGATGNFRIRIDSEIMLVTAISGNNLTATRGVEGTSAASHSNGAVVRFVLTSGGLAQYVADNAGAGGGNPWQGAYSSGTTYAINQSVTYNGILYNSLQNGNINHQPDINGSWWSAMTTSGSWKGAWNANTAYTAGDSVTYNYTLYNSVTSNNQNNYPNVIGSSYWTPMAYPGVMTQSYLNPGGQGDRTGGITVTSTCSWNGSLNAWVTTIGNNIGYFNTDASVTGKYVQFDFGNPVLITEATYNASGSTAEGTWQWSVSNDNVNFTNVGATFALGGATSVVITTLSGNTQPYRYYRMTATAGSVSNGPWIYGMLFKINGYGTTGPQGPAGAAGGLSNVNTGTLVNRPFYGSAGSLYYPSDAPYMSRDSGTAWEAFGPLYKLTLPIDANFSWVNQGSATYSVTNSIPQMVITSTGGADNMNMRVRTLANPITVTAALACTSSTGAGANMYGIGVRNSSTGNLASLGAYFQGGSAPYMKVHHGTATSLTSIYAGTGQYGWFSNGLIWLRIVSTSTQLTYFYSIDGVNWIQAYTETISASGVSSIQQFFWFGYGRSVDNLAYCSL